MPIKIVTDPCRLCKNMGVRIQAYGTVRHEDKVGVTYLSLCFKHIKICCTPDKDNWKRGMFGSWIPLRDGTFKLKNNDLSLVGR